MMLSNQERSFSFAPLPLLAASCVRQCEVSICGCKIARTTRLQAAPAAKRRRHERKPEPRSHVHAFACRKRRPLPTKTKPPGLHWIPVPAAAFQVLLNYGINTTVTTQLKDALASATSPGVSQRIGPSGANHTCRAEGSPRRHRRACAKMGRSVALRGISCH